MSAVKIFLAIAWTDCVFLQSMFCYTTLRDRVVAAINASVSQSKNGKKKILQN